MTAYYNEINPFAAACLRELIKEGLIAPGVVDERSIEDVRPGDLAGFAQCHFFAGIGVWSLALRLAGWPDDGPVWTGSCPCQPFSSAGKGAGFADERHLWPAFFHLVSICNPYVVFGEQVASKDGLAWLDLVQADLEGAGYAVGTQDTCAAGFGAPHIRQRLYWVADMLGTGLEGYPRHGAGGARQEREIQKQDRPTCEDGVPGRVADAERDGQHGRGRAGEGRRGEPANRSGAAVGVANPGIIYDDGRRYGSGAYFGERAEPPGVRASEGGLFRRGPTNGFWRTADWLYCRDGKWRAVEPGTSPLAHGIAARVGRLRNYGNAINAIQAKGFIEAYLEVCADHA